MADEKLNTGPAENIFTEAAEPIATPEQAAASEPQQEQTRPAIPEPGDVVVSFDKINELRAMLSQQEANEFVERELCCPYCGYMVGIAFSDCTGHLKLKCKKCKRISVLNFAYFCRRRFRRK